MPEKRLTDEFILKDFIVGLIVILAIVVGLSSMVKRSSLKGVFENFFTNKKIESVFNYCPEYAFLPDNDLEVEIQRVMKRNGFLDKKYNFLLSYKKSGLNSLEENLASDNLPKEQNTIKCTSETVEKSNLDQTLLASLLNVYPENLNNNYLLTSGNDSKYIIMDKNNSNNNNWSNNFSLNGIIIKEKNEQVVKGNCFVMSATGISSYIPEDKIINSEIETTASKFETNWIATTSADLSTVKTIEECKGAITQDNFTLTLKDEVWYATTGGLIKRRLLPTSLTGMIQMTPNGYMPVEINDLLTP